MATLWLLYFLLPDTPVPTAWPQCSFSFASAGLVYLCPRNPLALCLPLKQNKVLPGSWADAKAVLLDFLAFKGKQHTLLFPFFYGICVYYGYVAYVCVPVGEGTCVCRCTFTCVLMHLEVRNQQGVSSSSGWPVSYRGLSFSLPPQTCSYSHIWLLIDTSAGDLDFVPRAYAVGI